MKLPAYPRYKPSGVEWLGDVPENWETKKVTYGFSKIGSGTTPRSDSDDFYDGDVPWATTSELRETLITKTKENVTRSALLAHSALRLYPAGTLLFAMYGATIGRLGILGIPATLNQACCAFAAPTLFDTRFTFYWLWMRRPILISLSTGGGQPNLSQDDLRQIRIPTPPLSEQRTIAAFLDQETGRIDRLVAKKRELIERLKEKRTALISRTVTRGLPPAAARAAGLLENPPLKPSGIEWIGEIPKHWTLKRVGDELEFISYGFTNPMPTTNKGPRMVTANDVNDGRVLLESARCTDPVDFEKLTRKSRPKRRDILVTKDGTLGRVGVVESDEPFCINQSVALLRPKVGANEGFIALALQSPPYFDRMVFEAGGTTIKHIYITRLARMPFGAPSLPEQAAIAAYLDLETAKLDTLVGKVEEAVERLQEYRTALITAAVTGKIDVRCIVTKKPHHSVTTDQL